MTTELRKNSNPRLPAPDRYTAYLDRLLKEQVARGQENRVITWLLIVLIAVPVFIILAAILLK